MSLCLSIVSHRQAHLAKQLLADLNHCQTPERLVLTCNTPEREPLALPSGGQRIDNTAPLGFAGNHNQAFRHCREDFFCVLNADLRLPGDPFPQLLARMDDPKVGVVAPMVLSPAGAVEDNARQFPTVGSLLRKAAGGPDGRYAVQPSPHAPAVEVDWVAGMFLLFRAEAFRDVGGFDDKFFLYYEDVDICARLWKAGWKVLLSPDITVVHDAQRASRRDPQYMAWHASSMTRYFFKHLGRLPRPPSQPASRAGR
ncbi:MAG: glycosyltransferase family 2 protein [Burkholderiales bacterium]|nr:MAG: glycosyltransferase family 2 protein [Burkholderiales bacterium]